MVAEIYNSQTLPILEATANPNANAGVGGSEIVIVDDSALYPEVGSGGTADITPVQFNSDKISTYVVQEGDTISQIAEMFRVSTNAIRWGNDINTKDVVLER